MSRLLLASDFDGTLCRWPGDITPEDRAAVREFRAKGNMFIIVTGRDFGSAVGVLREKDFSDYDLLLCMSGSAAVSPEGEILYINQKDASFLPDLLQFLNETGANYASVTVDTETYGVDIDGSIVLENTVSREKAAEFKTVTNCCTQYPTLEKTNEMLPEIKRRFGEYVNTLQNHCCIDLPPAGVDKASAVRRVADTYNINVDNIYAVGDNLNDISMVSAYHGRAMFFAPEELKNSAEKTVEDIAEIIREIM